MDNPEIGHEGYAGCISIPYLTRSGVTSIRFRSIPPKDKIYLTLNGDTNRIFNPAALESSTVFITEGEMDAVTAHQCGLSAVGIPGVNGWKNSWGRALRYRQCAVLADNDEPGRAFGKRVASHIDGCKIITPPGEGMDLSDWYLLKGSEGVRKLVGM